MEGFPTPSSGRIEGVRLPSPEAGEDFLKTALPSEGDFREVEVLLRGSVAAEAREAAENGKEEIPERRMKILLFY
jgi:hypothetical protein